MALIPVDELKRASEEFEEATRTTQKEAAEYAAAYWRRKNPSGIVLADGEIVMPADNERELKALHGVLRRFIEENGPLEAEGLPRLFLQDATSKTVDILALAEGPGPKVQITVSVDFVRLLQSNGLLPNIPVLEGLEKGNLIGKVPRMPVAQTPRLTFDRRK